MSKILAYYLNIMEKHTYKSGIVGNCGYLAHIGKDTNVNWMCWPRFDSSFIFGGLLDEEKGGEFSIKPADQKQFESSQRYIENTMILITEVHTLEGSYRVVDYAPRFFLYERYYRPLMLIRKVEPLEGSPKLKAVVRPVGEYGSVKPNRVQGSNHIKYLGLGDEIRLTTNVSLTYVMDELTFVLNESKYFVLTYGAPLEAPLVSTAESFFESTKQYWRKWVKTTSISNFQQDAVIRSALTLKVHQYEDTGAIIAASTTSLPESPGSGRNWDYRYCWLRDTFYTLNAFNNIGHFEEVEAYFQYIANISFKNENRFQPLYTLSGLKEIVEKELDLKGYLGNKPVRIGNQAYEHIQNDVYGQILVALLPLFIDKRFTYRERADAESLIFNMMDKIEMTMNEPDAGLWEFRDFAQYHCYTFLFHWAGSSAAMNIARFLKNERMFEKAANLKAESTKMIEKCYDPERGVYTQAIGTKNLDASTLQLIMMNYLEPSSERARKHLEVMESELMDEDGLFYRYKHTDDFGEPESTFLICAFWYVEALAMVGRTREAIQYFENLIEYSNDLGLLSEDVDAKTGSQWGNFPQAYSHVGLLNAAYRIAKKVDKPNFL